MLDRRRASSRRVPAAALRPALGCVLLGSALGVPQKAGVDLPPWRDHRRRRSLVGVRRLRPDARRTRRGAAADAEAAPDGIDARPRAHPPATPSRPRRSTSCARSPPSSSGRCCCSAAARTRSCCCASPRRRSGPARFPFPLMHVDTGHNFPEVIEFRDRRVARARRAADRRLGAGVDRHRAASSRRPARAPRATACRRRRCSTRSPSTASTPRSAARAATRSAPAPRSASSRFRDDFGGWDPKAQRPELWNLYNGRIRRGEHVRVFPLSQLDRARRLAVHRRGGARDPVDLLRPRARGLRRDGMLYAARDVRRADATARSRSSTSVRYRTVGDMSCTGAVASTAADARRGRRRDRRDARSPSAARRAPTTASPRPRWRTARARATSRCRRRRRHPIDRRSTCCASRPPARSTTASRR